MNTTPLESQFAAMGARLKVREIPSRWTQANRAWISPHDFAVDIRRDGRGEFFEFRVPTHLRDSLDISVMQNEARQRHLLLAVRDAADPSSLDRFLCGHDERHWFVAAVPGRASSVRQALASLQPTDVRVALEQGSVPPRQRYTRKNPAFRRQGEWFFLPEPSLAVDERLVLRDEPIRRGRGKPHLVEQLYRHGGEVVHVCHHRPNGVTPSQYDAILRRNPAAIQWGWRVMRRNPRVYARGAVRHGDHATVVLPFWHRVLMNTEHQSASMNNVAFLD